MNPLLKRRSRSDLHRVRRRLIAEVAQRSGSPRGRRSRHLDGKRPYPANLCPLFCGVEFAGFGEDLGQPVGEVIEAMSGKALRQGTTEHLNGVLSEE